MAKGSLESEQGRTANIEQAVSSQIHEDSNANLEELSIP